MIEKVKIVTNNVLSSERFGDRFQVEFVDGSLMDVLIKTRDYIHKGHKLLTHPLSGSIKPNETPYKTIVISFDCGRETDYDSLMLIENSISTAEKFMKLKPPRVWPEKVLADFRLIDFDLIKNAL